MGGWFGTLERRHIVTFRWSGRLGYTIHGRTLAALLAGSKQCGRLQG